MQYKTIQWKVGISGLATNEFNAILFKVCYNNAHLEYLTCTSSTIL